MKNLDKILKSLEIAKRKNKKIAVLGDFDLDGITGATIFYQGLRNLNFKCVFLCLLPEGFSEKRIKEWKKKNISLGILIDIGIKKYKEINLARKKGIEIIVIDHHQAKKFPETLFYHSLKKAACQLSYEVIKNLYLFEKKQGFSKFLDLVSLGSLADKVPLTKSNKQLIEIGLKEINRGQRKGIKIFLDKLKIKKFNFKNQEKILNYFKFPKGGNEKNSFYRLFTQNDENELKKIAQEIIDNYKNSKKIIDRIIKTVSPNKTIFIENKITPFIPGLSGTLAEFILEKFNRPVFVYKINKNFIRVSARSPKKGVNLVNLFEKCSTFLKEYGGHTRAAGFKAKKEDLQKIKQCFQKIIP